MRRLPILALIVVGALFAPVTRAATLTVDLNGGADYTDIQSAIDAAAAGDTVLVKPGEYVITEPINLNRLHDPENPESPPVKDIAVKSEGGAEATTIRMARATNPDRASVVIFENGENEDSVIDGFLITGGQGTNVSSRNEFVGGGILCQKASSPTIRNCAVENNRVLSSGGGLWCENASPSVEYCLFSVNEAHSGGGIFVGDAASPTILRCSVTRNVAVDGAGVFCDRDSSPKLSGCTISGNGGHSGGGLFAANGSTVALESCTIIGNSADNSGGIGTEARELTLVNCVLLGNWSFFGAGLMEVYGLASSSVRLIHCTVAQNSSRESAGGIVVHNGPSVSVEGSIIWGNAVSGILAPEGTRLDVSHTITQESITGSGNIVEDPRFVRKGTFVFPSGFPVPGDLPDFIRYAGDYHLSAGSPAIDAGESSGVPDKDIEGNERPCGTGIDLGAYESCSGFLRGDANGDRDIDISDAIWLVRELYLDGPESVCDDASDANDDGLIDISDALLVINYQLRGGPSPAPPFPDCVADSTPDDLRCVNPSPCGAPG